MKLREPTPEERKEIKGLMDWLSRNLPHVRDERMRDRARYGPSRTYPIEGTRAHKKVKEFLDTFPKDVRLDTVYEFRQPRGPRPLAYDTGDNLYMYLMRGIEPRLVGLDLIRQVGERTPDITNINYASGKTTLEQLIGSRDQAVRGQYGSEMINDLNARVELATQLEKENKAKKLANPLVSLTKTAKDPLAQKRVPEDVESKIASFLTGSKGTVPEQVKSIRQTIGKGRRRRRTRRTAK